GAARADQLRDVVERLGDRAPLADRAAAGRGARGRTAVAGAVDRRAAGVAQRGGDGEAAVPRDRARGRARVSGTAALGEDGAAAPGVERVDVRRLPALRPREPPARAGASRGTGAPARAKPAR